VGEGHSAEVQIFWEKYVVIMEEAKWKKRVLKSVETEEGS
jgi:hypothetical protein